MKSGVCPKCKGRDILHHEGGTLRYNSEVLRLGFMRMYYLDVYACRGCGYLERYVKEPAKLPKGPNSPAGA